MQGFREHILARIITVGTAVIFLNMSFLLAEVNLLGMEKDARFSKIISLIISGTCFEEEKEVGGDTGEEDSSKKIDLSFQYQVHSGGAFVLLSEFSWALHHNFLLSANTDTFTPPPES